MIAARNDAFGTTAGFGSGSSSVPQLGTVTSAYVKPFATSTVPLAVVSVRTCAPTAPAGDTAVTVVGFTTVTLDAATPPIVTALVPDRFRPVIVTTVPPTVGPEAGLNDETVGDATYVKPSSRLAMPPGVEIDTVCGPTSPTGASAFTVTPSTTVTPVAARPPIVTDVVPIRFAPVMEISVLQHVGPADGDTDEIVGAAKYVKPFDSVAVPVGVTNTTCCDPAVPAGVTAVTIESFTTVTSVAAFPPTVTDVVPASALPVIVIKVPPESGPTEGVIESTTGTPAGVRATRKPMS